MHQPRLYRPGRFALALSLAQAFHAATGKPAPNRAERRDAARRARRRGKGWTKP